MSPLFLYAALNEKLTAEVHHLKLLAGEIRGSHVSSSSYQDMNPQMMQQEKPQIQNDQLAQFQQEQQQLEDLHNFIIQ